MNKRTYSQKKDKNFVFHDIYLGKKIDDTFTSVLKQIKNNIDKKKEKYIKQIQKGDESSLINWQNSSPRFKNEMSYTIQDTNFKDFVFYSYLKFIFKYKLEEKIHELDFDYIYFELKEKLTKEGLFKLLTNRSKEFIVYIMSPDHYVALVEEAIDTKKLSEFRENIDKLYDEYKVLYENDEKKLLDRKLKLEAYKRYQETPRSGFSSAVTDEEIRLEDIPSLGAVVVGGKTKITQKKENKTVKNKQNKIKKKK